MIATILPSSPTFHAVAYNEKKVAAGSASLLELKNFGAIDTFGYSSPEELSKYLIEYTSANTRIRQPQMHLAISCKGNEYTPEQLMGIAHEWLNQMGYGDPEQPLLIYEHHDTDNTHIHVITSRVDPQGRKINDSNERRRSQKVLDKIMRTDLKKESEKNLSAALSFEFKDATQFKAILEAMNYECFEKDETIYVKKGGMVQTSISQEDVKKVAEKNKLRRNIPEENTRLKAILSKYRDLNSSAIGLQKDLRNLFGISLVFFGKRDSPYGYAIVDFNKKKVYSGGKVLGINRLLDFRTKEEHLAEIEDVVHQAFAQSPYITTKQLNDRLKRFGAYAKKEIVYFGNHRKPLEEVPAAMLKRNNKLDWINKFNPQSEDERNLVCKYTGFDAPNLVKVRESRNYYTKDYEELSAILRKTDLSDKLEELNKAEFRFINHEGKWYVCRISTQTVVDLERSGLSASDYAEVVEHFSFRNHSKKDNDMEQVRTASHEQPRRSKVGFSTTGNNAGGSGYANREWEVGKHGYDPDDQDAKQGMSY